VPSPGAIYTAITGSTIAGTCAGSIGTYTLTVGSTTVTLTA